MRRWWRFAGAIWESSPLADNLLNTPNESPFNFAIDLKTKKSREPRQVLFAVAGKCGAAAAAASVAVCAYQVVVFSCKGLTAFAKLL